MSLRFKKEVTPKIKKLLCFLYEIHKGNPQSKEEACSLRWKANPSIARRFKAKQSNLGSTVDSLFRKGTGYFDNQAYEWCKGNQNAQKHLKEALEHTVYDWHLGERKERINLNAINNFFENVAPIAKKASKAKPPTPRKNNKEPKSGSEHDDLVRFWETLGNIQGYRVEKEYQLDSFRYDVTWWSAKAKVPDFVIEVCVGGNLEKDFAALKHAHDLWRCNNLILCVVNKKIQRANNIKGHKGPRISDLQGGAFHELQDELSIVSDEEVQEVGSGGLENLLEFATRYNIIKNK